MSPLLFHHNQSAASQVFQHLRHCDLSFMPPLSSRLSIADYSNKIYSFAERFECTVEDQLIGLIAMYCNDPLSKNAHITSVSVYPEHQGLGIAKRLMQMAIQWANSLHFQKISLHVNPKNEQAIQLYHKFGFSIVQHTADEMVEMTLTLHAHETRLQ